MPINILGESRYPEGYRRGPGLDSKGRAGPTLQRIADEHKTRKNNASLLEAAFENLAPIGMYSGDAEAIHLPSKTMTNAKTLASLFQDWFKGGTPTINVPFDKWPEIIKSGKFKNQMELAGKAYPEAWKQRIEVEKKLGGFPYPREAIMEPKEAHNYWLKLKAENIRKSNKTNTEKLEELRKIQRIGRGIDDIDYSESLAKKNPVYGHIYNKKYNDTWDATGFGDTHAEMTDLIKEQSKYVLGDSFHPFVKTAFSSDDLLGNTSRLERALFKKVKGKNEIDIEHNSKNLAPFSYMEMWVPNYLARLNNVKSVHVPAGYTLDKYPTALPSKNVPRSFENSVLRDMQQEMDQLDPNFKNLMKQKEFTLDNPPDHIKIPHDWEDIFPEDFPF